MKNGRITAMILDDEISVRNGLLRHIRWKRLGIDSVETFESAERAAVYLENHAPDVIISDIRLPKMDGIQLMEYVREKGLRCRIIFMSAYSDLEYYRKAIRLEAEAYIEKPIRPEQMEERVFKNLVHGVWEERLMECIGGG